jgi:hypothetical protein
MLVLLQIRPYTSHFVGARLHLPLSLPWARRPAIPLAAFTNPAALQEFLSVLDWYISEGKAV